MNQEKEKIQTVNSAGEYSVPKVEVVEIRTRRVICASCDGVSGTGEETDMP